MKLAQVRCDPHDWTPHGHGQWCAMHHRPFFGSTCPGDPPGNIVTLADYRPNRTPPHEGD